MAAEHERVEEVENEETPAPASDRKSRRKGHPKRRESVIPKTSFARLVKELSVKHGKTNMIWSVKALDALQEYIELYVEKHFRVSGELANLCKKHTITKEIFDFLDKFKEDIVGF